MAATTLQASMGLGLSAVREELVWIDCEMTGLDLRTDKLIEIAALVTDAELNVLGEGIDVVIHADDEALDGMIEVVAQMHSRSGLTEEVRASVIDVPAAEELVMDYIRSHVKQAKTAPLAGNSIATDRGFIARDMPTLDNYLHYRMIDVSSIKELCRRWYPRIYYGQPEKGGLAHRALADIRESIRELKYYRRTAFVPSRGGRRPAKLPLRPPRSTRCAARIRLKRPTTASIDDAAAASGRLAAMVAVVQLVEHQVVILLSRVRVPSATPPTSQGADRLPDFFCATTATGNGRVSPCVHVERPATVPPLSPPYRGGSHGCVLPIPEDE